MNIVMIGNSDVAIYTYRRELAEQLLKSGHKVTILSPYGSLIEDLKEMGCDYRETKMDRHGTNPAKDLSLMRSYRRMLKEISPDIVFAYTIKPNIWGAWACKSLKIPCVINITGLGTAVENSGLLQKITVLLYKLGCRKVQTIFFQNKENMEFFHRRNLYRDKHKLLPGSGVNLDRFRPTEYPSEETVEFVFISRIIKEKGIDQYLEAAERLREKYPHTRFHVCGPCEEAYEERLANLHEAGTVIYHGTVKDIRGILERVHCTVHPTYYPEGLSNVLLESCASARPIITTDRAGCREVLEDGVNGFVVKQQDAEDLVRCLEKFLALSHEEKRALGLAGREKVEREFDRNIVIQAYFEEIGEVYTYEKEKVLV